MKRHLGTIHRVVGIAALLLFFATGQFMDRQGLDRMPIDSVLRQMYRSRHIYLLFGGLLNLAVGLRFILPIAGTGSRVAVAGSVLMLASPLVMAFAFFVEPVRLGHSTILTIVGVFASYVGLIFYSVGIWRLRAVDALAPN